MSRCEFNLVDGVPVFLEDQYEWPYKWNKNTLTYQVLKGTEDIDARNKLRKMVGLALTTWAAEIPIKFRHVKKGETPDIKITFQNDPNVDEFLKEKPTVLAYAYYPKTESQGVVVFNDYAYEWGVEASNHGQIKVYNAIQVLTHELGHTLGLSHDTSHTGRDMMDPYYDGTLDNLSPNDIIRIRKKYGIRNFSRWNLYSRLKTYLSHRKKNM